MDNSKYYTPEIEEFHVGFEYESAQVDTYFHVNEWTKGIVDLKFSIEVARQYPGLYRVKYLDEEDILSLGFEKPSVGNGYKKDYYTLFWSADDKFDKTHIAILEGLYDNGTVRFSGLVKNKSELKKLLKQLGI